MTIAINSNPTASMASQNLAKANKALQMSISRLSSGNRIVSPSDDAGGFAVAYKLNSQLGRNEVLRQNIQNGISLLQVQDGAMEVTGSIVVRISELRTMAQDITKNTSDIENYSKEFIELQRQLAEIYREKFNGVDLFTTNSGGTGMNEDSGKFSYTLLTHDSGQFDDGSVSLNVVNLQTVLSLDADDESSGSTSFTGVNLGNVEDVNVTNFIDNGSEYVSLFSSDGFLLNLLSVSVDQLNRVIDKIADARAENGAEQGRLVMVDKLLSGKITDLESAHGKIMDVDVALESSRLAKNNVLVQSSAAMVSQANNLTSIALALING